MLLRVFFIDSMGYIAGSQRFVVIRAGESQVHGEGTAVELTLKGKRLWV